VGSGIFFPLSAIPISVLLLILIYKKEHVINVETSIYQKLVLANFFGLILEILCTYASYIHESLPFVSNFIFKSYLIYLICWTCIFTYYIFKISYSGEKDKTINKKLLFLFFLLTVVITFILPINLVIENNFQTRYTNGPSVIFAYSISSVLVVIILYILLKNYKKINDKKYIPVLIFFTIGTISIIIQSIFPQLLLLTYVETFICLVMYFTIENPDVQMLEQVEFAKDQAERANKAKTDFLSSMSHEIRTPLNAIVGFSQSLKTEDLPASAMEEVDDIIEASETLLDTVNGVLDISKIEANKIEIVDSVYNFHKVFDELVSLSKARLGESKPIDFRYELAPDTPKYLYGDYARVKQVVLNFLTNAIKYTNEGYIDFKVRNITNNGICRLIITVEDSGIGIKKESITKLFDKFERLDNENSTIEGTGLGLAITKKLVELMHGRIIVQSIFGKGSQFTVVLDQKLVDDKDIPMEEATAAVVNIDYSKKKILIVDDNKLNLKVAARLLKPYNVQTFEVLSGFECLDLIGGGNTYDLILMDDMMPKMSGKETFKKLKEEPTFTTPVVILTANAITGMKEQYLADGFDDYLAKPIDKSELERVLRKYLG